MLNKTIVPTVIKSKYFLKTCLSEDVFYYLYSGYDQEGASVSIYVYKPEYVSVLLGRRLIQLADQLVGISHPSLLTLLDYDYDGRCFFAIYEGHQEMTSLFQFLQKNQSDLSLLWGFVVQLLQGLLFLEQQQLVHGFLNLNSVFVTSDRQIKLVHSALLIELLSAHFHDFELFEEGVFLPPEFLYVQDYDLHSDMYSVGVLLYFLFSRRWPYDLSLKVLDIKKSILSGVRPFCKLKPTVPDKMVHLIHRCLMLDPQQRFHSFSVLMDDYSKGSIAVLGDQSASYLEHFKTLLLRSKYLQWRFYLGWGMVFLFLFLLIGSCVFYYQRFVTGIPLRLVPSLMGLSGDEAKSVLRTHDLRAIVAGERVSLTVPKGFVLETKPPSGREVKENRLIRLYLSKGIDFIRVPDLKGFSKENVAGILSDLGLLASVSDEVYSSEFGPDVVISQRPSANHFILPSENVKVVVSKGFPVEAYVDQDANYLLSLKGLKKVFIHFYVLQDWSRQQVTIHLKLKHRIEKLYDAMHEPGELVKLEFDLEKEGVIEVLFNQDLGFKSSVGRLKEVEEDVENPFF